jgi:hypothetical protein
MKSYLIGVLKSYLIVALLLGTLVALASNQDAAPKKWGRAGLWEIDVDRAAGDVCFATRWYLTSGVVVRVGVNPAGDGLHFMIGGKKFDSLAADRLYNMKLMFEDGKSYEREFEAKKTPRALIFINHVAGDDLAADLMSKSRLRIYHGNALMAGLSLDDAGAALTQMMACQKEMAAAASGR